MTKGSPVWFKVAEDGLRSKDVWGTTPLMTYPGVLAGVNYTVPKCLKSGYFLVRHEIIALHNGWKEGGAQFYPGCHQLKVEGGGDKVVKDGLVSFPGAYKSTDPGILYDAYKQSSSYTVPGPKVFTC